jgi:fumarate reductase subunit D
VHSLTDFNLHIPANAALFYVMAAAATVSPRRASSPRLGIHRVEL